MSYSTINVRTNFPDIAARMDRLPKEIGDKALVRSMNKTIDQGKTEMARGISREFRLTVAKAKERLAVRKAYAKGGVLHFQAELLATSKAKGRSMNIIAFVENKTTLGQARKRAKAGTLNQLHFQIKRSGGKKIIPGAFIGNKGRTVFIREGKGRLPIKAVNTIDIPQMFNTKRINIVVRKVMLNRLGANFKRELRSVLGGWAR